MGRSIGQIRKQRYSSGSSRLDGSKSNGFESVKNLSAKDWTTAEKIQYNHVYNDMIQSGEDAKFAHERAMSMIEMDRHEKEEERKQMRDEAWNKDKASMKRSLYKSDSAIDVTIGKETLSDSLVRDRQLLTKEEFESKWQTNEGRRELKRMVVDLVHDM